jgi:two-component system, sensor histidine kinase and response regulator
MKSTQDQSPAALPGDGLVPLESILCTEELNRRPTRPPDYETENRALVSLAQALAESPRTILQTLADKTLEVFQAGSAGLSLLTKADGGKRFYWPAIAGTWKPHVGGGTPRDFGPCGDVLDRNVPLLFRHFERRYPYLLPVTPPAVECLLVPFYVEGKAVGTIWAITHDDRRKFDLEDLRQLASLGTFASSAYQVTESLAALDQQGETLRQREERWRLILDNAHDSFVAMSADGLITEWNRQAEIAFGWPRAEAVGRVLSETIIPPRFRDDHRRGLARFLATGEGRLLNRVVEVSALRRDGSEFPIEISIAPVRVGEQYLFAAFIRDVTERKRAEERLRGSEERLRFFVEHAPAAVAMFDRDMRYLLVSQRWLTDFGLEDRDIIGRSHYEVFPDIPERWKEVHRRCLAAAVERCEEDCFERADGRVDWLRWEVRPWRNQQGEVGGILIFSEVITEQKRAEDALRKREEELRHANTRLELAVRGSDVGVWDLVLPDGDYRRRRRHSVNVWEQLGYDGPPAGRESALDETDPDDRAQFEEAVRRYLAGGTTEFEREIRLRHKDGSYRTMLARGAAVRDAAGKPLRMVGVTVDITDLKRAEEALRASEAQFRQAVLYAPFPILIHAEGGEILQVSRTWTELTGYTQEDLRTISDWTRRAYGERQGLVQSDIERLYDLDTRVHEGEYIITTRSSETRIWDFHTAPLGRLPDGRRRVITMAVDVTERKRAEEELRRAKEAAEAANLAKDEFLANVSHEIRTPMNAILGMTELALDTPLADDQRHYLTTVKSAADALLGIINDILDFAKIEAGRLELDPADFSLGSVLDATLRALAVRAHRKGLELVSQQRPDVPDALVGDAGRLRQVLLNLVGNAIKFTERGEVVVLVETAGGPAPAEAAAAPQAGPPAAGGEVLLRFAVTDTGIGIPPEKQATIFRAFEQEDTSTTRKYGGTGLGLTIAARLVALLGGEITVDSGPRRGSTFAFTARFGLQPHPPETAAGSPPAVLRGLPVLIVDDNATNRHILEEWLHGCAMEPTAAGDGVTAMAALWRGVAQDRPYPLALLDGRMPDIDGLALAAKIREQAELSATRLILLSSGDRPGDLARARQLGISANLLKPLQQRELMETILRVMGHEGDPEGLLISPAEERPPVPEGLVGVPLRILAAEDNDFNRDLLEHVLTRLGLAAAMAVNGREALALLEREPFDLLLLDIHMPELDGFGVIGAVRQRERTAGGHLPVIALTARSRQEDRERCLRAGMDECLVKPFTAADLWAAMARVLRTHPPRQPPRLDQLDPPVLLAACGGDPAMLRKMCRSLQSRVPEYLAAIRDALHAQDAPRLREAAHKFCGMLSAFSTAAGERAADLEDLAARGLLPEALPVVEQLDRCATELARLAGGLTVEALRKQAEPADDPNRTASP